MEYLKITKAPSVTLYKRGFRFEGDLHLTTHHLIFTYKSPTSSAKELWISYPIIDSVELKSGSCLLDVLYLSNRYNLSTQLLDGTGLSNETINEIQNLKDIAKLYYNSCLKIKCKDFLNLSIDFNDNKMAKDVFESIKKLTCLQSIKQLYAFLYTPVPIEKRFNSWQLYDIQTEFERQGLDFSELSQSDSNNKSTSWRISSINHDYSFCESYSQKFVVPATISDSVLKYAKKFRSKNRIPVLTYYHKQNGCTITRSAQPLTGLSQSRSVQDEKLVFEIFASNIKDRSKMKSTNLIIDARPTANAMAQTALGAGTEIIDNYRNCQRKFLGIDNIHVIRDSLQKVCEALKDSDLLSQLPSVTSSILGKSGWLRHISILLSGVDLVVKSVHLNDSHCLVHCSDGWDRTSQVCSLAQVCLDPYFRTLEGFMILIEKDWFSFGHRFKERSGHLSSETKFINNNEKHDQNNEKQASQSNNDNSESRAAQPQSETSGSFIQFEDGFSLNADSLLNSDTINNASKSFNKITNHFKKKKHIKFTAPIFQQFLDCVYQIVIQNPSAFEFNERFLRRLVYHLYSCQYGNFLADNEKERFSEQLNKRTRSVWDYFLSRKREFMNPDYVAVEDLIIPNCENLKWWYQLYGRTSEEMNGSNEIKKLNSVKARRETNLNIMKTQKMNEETELVDRLK